MKTRYAIPLLGGLVTGFLLAGCTTPLVTPPQAEATSASWQGRLSLQVPADIASEPERPRSFSAAFELQGNALQGQLRLLTPLGSTAAAIFWTAHQARLQARGETRVYDNLEQLTLALMGTDVPVVALFAWLDGKPYPAPGWQVDLSLKGQGKIKAHRLLSPEAELRVVLEP